MAKLDVVFRLKKQIISLLLISLTGISNCDLFAQVTPAKPSRQSSLEAFSKGNYEEAYKEFRELLLTYSKDPQYKYYSGVCLVNLKRDPAEAETLLKQAVQGAAVVKTLPSDALFYLGRAQQMQGKFTEAVETYSQCSDQIGKKASRELNIPGFIQECNEKKGQIAEIKPSVTVKNEKEVVQVTVSPSIKEDTVIPVQKALSVKKNLPGGTDNILNEALVLQAKADSLSGIVSEQRKQLDKAPVDQRNGLKAKISENEIAAAALQKAADLKYSEAHAALNPQKGATVLYSAPRQAQPPVMIDSIKKVEANVIKPDLKLAANQNVKVSVRETDTIKKADSQVNNSIEMFSIFEIQPKAKTDPAEKIKIDPEIPQGLIYRIQIAVFRNPVAPAYFKGITPIYGFKVTGTDKTSYFAGMFRRSADASKSVASVRARGFKDAFVVALLDGKAVSADRAAILEKEWGKKPFMTINKPQPKMAADTISRTLVFRVEVTKSLKPLKEDVIEGFRKIAGNRGLDIQLMEDGSIAYLIGKFITFETASEYADLLTRNGYRESRVVAWMGKKEIPVDTARQLFDKLK